MLFLTAPSPLPASSLSASAGSTVFSVFSSLGAVPNDVAAVVPDAVDSTAPTPAPVLSAAVDTTAANDEDRWESVAGSAHNTQKAKGQAKREMTKQVVERKRSLHISENEAPLYVDAVTKATRH
jgi:hypothetical protein